MGYKLALLGTVAVLVQSISGQCIGNSLNAGPARGFSNGPYGPNLAGIGSFNPNLAGKGQVGLPGCAASTGGSFAVKSSSPVSPIGVSVLAENLAIEGPLAVGGNLPFLGTVGIEGAMPGGGVGTVSYGCGNGNVGIASENAVGVAGPYGLAASVVSPAASSYGSPIGPSPAASGYNYGASVAPAMGPYSIAGIGLGSKAGPSLGPSAVTGSFGLAGSSIGPSGYGFGSGLGFNGFNGLRQ